MTNEITTEVLEEFKLRMKLDGNDEDLNLTRILSSSVEDLLVKCGPLYDIESSYTFKELVFERSRYVYNDALEYFDSNFLSQITNLALVAEEPVINP